MYQLIVVSEVKFFGEVGFTVTQKTLILFWTSAPLLMVNKQVLRTKLSTTQVTNLNVIAVKPKARRLLQLMVRKILLIFESLSTR